MSLHQAEAPIHMEEEIDELLFCFLSVIARDK